MLCAVEFDASAFRAAFPAFADSVAFPSVMLERAHNEALCFISPRPGKRLRGDCHVLALDLMTAHLLALEMFVTTGATSGLVSGATVDKVSVTLTPPPIKSQYGWWLSLTPYGAKLLALLRSKASGGLYVGGTPTEREAFRKAGGVFVSAKRTS